MPIVQRPRNYRLLSEFEIGRIIGMNESGTGFREFTRRVERNINTIICYWKSRSVGNRHHQVHTT